MVLAIIERLELKRLIALIKVQCCLRTEDLSSLMVLIAKQKYQLTKPVLGNGGVIWENIEDITFPDFKVEKLKSAAEYKRGSSYRKNIIKTKISWGTKTPVPAEPPLQALSIKVWLGITKNDRLLILPNGEIWIYCEGKKYKHVGNFNFKNPNDSRWLPNIPVEWITSDPGVTPPLDRALIKLIEEHSNAQKIRNKQQLLDHSYHDLYRANTKTIKQPTIKAVKAECKTLLF
jgi:hypothetical protein